MILQLRPDQLPLVDPDGAERRDSTAPTEVVAEPGLTAAAAAAADVPLPTAPSHTGGRVAVPDLSGLEVLEALHLARQFRLRLSISVWETKIGPWGRVLAQLPTADTSVRSGSRIAVTVAGRPHLTLPDVRGHESSEAMVMLRRSGLHPMLSGERGSRSLAPGHVIETRPRPGALVVHGSPVELVTARAPGRPPRP